MSDFYVYRLRLDGELQPFYIGKGRGIRWRVHTTPDYLRQRNRKAMTIRGALKRGQAVLPEKMHTGLSEVDAHDLECFWIAFYGRKSAGTGVLANMTSGGEGVSGLPCPDETRKRISASLKGRRKPPEEVAKRCGKKLSDAHIAAIRAGAQRHHDEKRKQTTRN